MCARTSLAALAALLALAGCGDDSDTAGKPVTAVATTTHVADFVRSVGGERVEVRALVRPNSDPHDYEPRPSDAKAVAEADVVFRSGGDLDEWLDDVLEGAGEDVQQRTLIDSVGTIEGEGGTDPHWWQDPRNVERAIGAVRATLLDVDPEGSLEYEPNAENYIRRLRALDREIAGCIGELRPEERKLVTTHDAFGYFATRYELEVIGALIPSLSSQAQPSAGETVDLIEQIKREGVKAIFPESALNPKLEEAVAREAGAKVGGALRADSLGPEGSGAETYVEAIASDAETIVDGLSGGRVRCRPDTRRGG